jgi:DNA-directed RNA polymerase subunit M/transcription elongation factor TFIIS
MQIDLERARNRTCPECGSRDYAFRSRKAIPAVPEKNEVPAVETKYHCKACGHAWRERVAG